MPETPLEKIIAAKLRLEFEPDILSINDDSHKHAAHNPEAVKGGTHFHIKIVSKKFKGMTRLQCHRWVYRVLESEINGGLHALALTLSD